MVEIFDGCVDGLFECGDVGEGLMGQVVRLEVMPDDLDVIEFERIFGQPFDGVSWSPNPGQVARRESRP